MKCVCGYEQEFSTAEKTRNKTKTEDFIELENMYIKKTEKVLIEVKSYACPICMTVRISTY